MNILTMEDVKKSYGTKVLFEDVHLAIGKRQKVGVIGLNGAGKTTLYSWPQARKHRMRGRFGAILKHVFTMFRKRLPI